MAVGRIEFGDNTVTEDRQQSGAISGLIQSPDKFTWYIHLIRSPLRRKYDGSTTTWDGRRTGWQHDSMSVGSQHRLGRQSTSAVRKGQKSGRKSRISDPPMVFKIGFRDRRADVIWIHYPKYLHFSPIFLGYVIHILAFLCGLCWFLTFQCWFCVSETRVNTGNVENVNFLPYFEKK